MMRERRNGGMGSDGRGKVGRGEKGVFWSSAIITTKHSRESVIGPSFAHTHQSTQVNVQVTIKTS